MNIYIYIYIYLLAYTFTIELLNPIFSYLRSVPQFDINGNVKSKYKKNGNDELNTRHDYFVGYF